MVAKVAAIHAQREVAIDQCKLNFRGTVKEHCNKFGVQHHIHKKGLEGQRSAHRALEGKAQYGTMRCSPPHCCQ